MIYISYFILGFSFVQFFVSFINLITKTKQRKSNFCYSDKISILIPARNEEKNISNVINDVLNQNYKNFELLIFDDSSTDKTYEIAKKFSEKDNRIQIIKSNGLPDDWLGKNYACYCLSEKATGDYFLFLDADVRIGNDLINNSVHFAKEKKLGLVSIFPKQIMRNFAEKITVPVMNFVLVSLLPLILVLYSKKSSLSAANGQFMFFDKKIYKKLNPHFFTKKNKVEDIAIASFYKKNKIKIACLLGDENIKCRMYSNFEEAVSGFSKNVIQYFGNSYITAISFWFITTFGLFFILLFCNIYFFVVYLSLNLMTRIFISAKSNQNIFENLLFAIFQQISLGLFILKAIRNIKNKNFIWKERNIS